MPAPSAFDDSGRPRLVTGLFWLGVGLAPIAALMLLVAEGSAILRIGAVLALLAVVLIALAGRLRHGDGSARRDLAESLAGQRDQMRGEVRAAVAAGAQATHRMVGEQLRSLRGEIEALRGQVDAIWAGAAGPGLRPDGGRAAVGARYSAAAPGDAGAFSYVGGHEQPAVAVGSAVPPSPPLPRPRASSGRAAVPPAGVASPPQVPTGVVRHTETVHVTTRQTIVEPDGDRSDSAYGSGYYQAAAWTVPAQRRRSAEPEPDGAAGGHRDDRPVDPGGSDGDKDRPRTRVRARDRWATAAEDGGEREVRLGRRRGHVRADESGTEVRFEDRWAAVREVRPDHREGHRDGSWSAGWWQDGDPPDRWAEANGSGEWPDRGAEPAEREWTTGDQADQAGKHSDQAGKHSDQAGNDSGQGWTDRGWNDSDHGWSGGDQGLDGPESTGRAWEQNPPAALPAGRAAVSSWPPAGSEPERQPVRRGHRYRDDSEAYGFPPSNGAPRAGGRQVGFERSDSRWG